MICGTCSISHNSHITQPLTHYKKNKKMETLTELKPGDKVISELSDVVLIFKEYSDKHVILEVEKTGIIIKAEKGHLSLKHFKQLS